ncbi:MAG TPA: hypothetical protein VGK72_01820 [Chthoniobacterales bacterium]
MNNSFLLFITLFSLCPCLALAQADMTPTSGGSSGIEGTIMVSPTQGGPVRKGVPSTAGLPKTAFVVKQGDKVVTSFETDTQGHFKVMLPAGHYTVTRQNYQGAVGHYGPFEVTVTEGKMATVQWQCDTGLR